MAVKPIPDGYHSVTPYLVVDGAAKLIDFARQAFGAAEKFRMDGPGGTVGHAELQIGDSIVMLSDAVEGMSTPTTAMLHLYVEKVDDVFKRAVAAGGTPTREPADQFYGDRSGGVTDAWGNQWWISTHVEDVPPDEMEKRAAAAMAQA